MESRAAVLAHAVRALALALALLTWPTSSAREAVGALLLSLAAKALEPARGLGGVMVQGEGEEAALSAQTLSHSRGAAGVEEEMEMAPHDGRALVPQPAQPAQPALAPA